MSRIKNILEAIKGSEDFSELRASSLRDILTGRILTKRVVWKQYGLAALIALFAFFYIDNRFYCEKQLAKEIKLKKQLQDIKYESLTISAELMKISRQSYVQRLIIEKGIDLKDNKTAAVAVD